MSTTALYRAVMPEEAADILAMARFRNVAGIENKCFAMTFAGAALYAARATAAFNDGPFTLMQTSIPSALITWPLEVSVDGGISTFVVPTAMLKRLSPPVIIGVP